MNISDEELLISMPQSIKLPYSKIEQPYTLEVHVELNSLLEDIWKGENIDFSAVVDAFKKEHEEHFLTDLDSLVDECRSYATLLHLNNEALYNKVYESLLELLTASLNLSPKIARKSVKRFIYSISEEIAKKQRYELLGSDYQRL